MELTMNTIIVAVIALVVLIVLILIFTGKIRLSSEGAQGAVKEYTGEKCEIPGTGRVCRPRGDCQNMGGIDNGQLSCVAGMTCCSK